MQFCADMNWSEARKLKGFNERFLQIADQVANDKKGELGVTQVEYSFGDMVVSNGKLLLPEQSGLKKVAFGVVVDRALEVFSHVDRNVVPIAILNPGQTFVLSDEANHFGFPIKLLNISAGARSIFLLPKITDTTHFWRLARVHGLRLEVPKTFHDQWYVFKDIAQHANCAWRTTVLLFDDSWLSGNSAPVLSLQNYLVENELPNPHVFGKRTLFQMLFAEALNKLELRPDPYLADNIKHLFDLASGFLPAFTFAQNDSFAPVALIQKAFMNDYGLHYAPHMLHPGYYNDHMPCYYSLQMPTLLAPSPRHREETNLQQLREMHNILKQVMGYIAEHQDTPIVQEFGELKNLEVMFFDPHVKHAGAIEPSSLMEKHNHEIKRQTQKFKTPFCDTSGFMSRGCISLMGYDPQVGG